MMKPLSPIFLIMIFSLSSSTSILFAQAPPGFPTQPMIVHGEVLVNGKNAAASSSVEARIGSTTVAVADIKNDFGFGSYVLEIKKSQEVSKDSRLSIVHGDHAADGSLVWKEGGSANQNILTHSTLKNRATIKTADVVKDAEGWKLQCEFDPMQQDGITADAVTYRLRWYVSKEATDSDSEAETRMIKEQTVTSTETTQTLTLDPSSIPDSTGFLHFVITPILNNGEKGPSAIQKVKTELKEAEL